jgi:uncharacterized protein (UPF0335 family)
MIVSIGHNNPPHPLAFSMDPELRAFVDRIERLEAEKKNTAEDIRSVYAEAKAKQIDVRALRAVIKLRREDAAVRAAHEAAIDEIMHKLGMI